jgi:hypothetical protein
VETTSDTYYAGTWNNPTEGNRHFWQIKDVVRRTNLFHNKETAAAQREHYNPRHLANILAVFEGDLNYYTWIHYKALSKGIESIWGVMDVNNTMEMLRNVYHGHYDPLWYLVHMNKETWWQWVACPKTGDFLISFATADETAFENPIHRVNLMGILANESPF